MQKTAATVIEGEDLNLTIGSIPVEGEDKDAVKAKLIENKDFDLHEVGDLRVSVSAVANVKVVDMDKVPADFKEVKTVADIKKAKEYLKVMKRVPEGFEDTSFYRLNWRINDAEKTVND